VLYLHKLISNQLNPRASNLYISYVHLLGRRQHILTCLVSRVGLISAHDMQALMLRKRFRDNEPAGKIKLDVLPFTAGVHQLNFDLNKGRAVVLHSDTDKSQRLTYREGDHWTHWSSMPTNEAVSETYTVLPCDGIRILVLFTSNANESIDSRAVGFRQKHVGADSFCGKWNTPVSCKEYCKKRELFATVKVYLRRAAGHWG